MTDQSLLRLLSTSRHDLVRFLKRQGTATVDEIALAIDLAPTTVRQHLDRLLEQELLVRESIAEGPGRPTMYYGLSPTAEALFPSQDSALFGQLVQFLLHQGYPSLVDEFFQRAWQDRQQEFQRRLERTGAQTIEDRLEVLREFLAEQGFLPELTIDEDQAILHTCNCPFSEGVRATRLPCRLEAQFLEQAIGRPLSREGYIPDGAPMCSYLFSLREESER